jgi:hypothetical protein
MIKHIEKCPSCGNYTEGQPMLSLARQAQSFGAKKGVSYILTHYVLPLVLGTIIFPAVGTFVGFLIACYFAYQAQKYSEKVSKELDKQVYKNVTYNFTCSKCGKTWQKVFETGESDMPKELINKEKTGKYEDAKINALMTGFFALIAVTLFIIGIYYCDHYDSTIATGQMMDTFFGSVEKHDTNWWWWFWALMVFVNFFISIAAIIGLFSFASKAISLRNSSDKDYLHKYYN